MNAFMVNLISILLATILSPSPVMVASPVTYTHIDTHRSIPQLSESFLLFPQTYKEMTCVAVRSFKQKIGQHLRGKQSGVVWTCLLELLRVPKGLTSSSSPVPHTLTFNWLGTSERSGLSITSPILSISSTGRYLTFFLREVHYLRTEKNI